MKTTKTVTLHPHLLQFVRPSDHSKFSPSASDRWLIEEGSGCAYSIEASKDIPNESSIYSEEGTTAHSVCEALFRQEFFLTPFPVELSMQMLKYDNQEMLDCAHQYVDVVAFWLKNKEVIGDVIHYGLEMGVPVFPEEGCFGTADCIIIGSKASVVIDFKYGKGKAVAASTTQLKVYAAGLARYLSDLPEGYKIFTVIHQPRTDIHPKEHFWTMPELSKCLGSIWASIKESKRTDLAPIEGNHCFWCPAARTKDLALMCSVKKEKPLKMAKENFGKFLADMNAPIEKLSDPNPGRDNAIMKIMALLPLMERIVKDGEAEFLMRLQSGEAIPGCRMVDKVGNRVLNFEDDAQAAQVLKEKFKIDAWKEIPATKKLMTITEIEKLAGKNKLDSVCVRKITKKVDIMDEKMRDILGSMAAYGQMLNNGSSQE